MSWRGPQEEVEVVVEEKLKRIFNSLDRRYGERKGFVRRSDAIKALVLVLGPEDEPDDDEMVMICPQSWRSEELSYEQFRDIIHVAGALGALRKIDNNHLERSWASLSDPESSYTVEFPIQSKDELQPASGSKGFTDRIQRFQADGGKLKDLVYEMILSHDSGPPKSKKRQSEDEESTLTAAEVNEQVERTGTCGNQHPDASKRVENPVDQSSMPQEDSSQTTTTAEPQSYQDLSGPLKVWNIAKSLVAGGLAGVVAKTTIAPLDRTKIIFQTTEKQFSLPAASKEIQRIVREEGVKGLWRGHTATIARVMPYAGIQFVSFDAYKALLLADGEKTLTPINRLLAGSMAGATSVFCTYPLDLMRARMSVQHTNYGGMHHNFRTVLRADGAAGLYRGLVPTLVGILPYAGLAFGTFETLKIMVSQHYGTETVNGQQRFYCGVIAGFVAQSLTYPLDIVRRRMQTDGAHMLPGQTTPNARQYHSILQTLRHVSTREGVVGGLYKGLTMNWIKGPIAHGISFTTFDFLKRNFDVKQRVSK